MGKPERSLATRRPNVQGKTRAHVQTVERTRKTQTHTQCSYAFMRRRGAWASPNAPSSQDDRKYKGKHEHTHKRSYAFMKRRGAWARPKRSLVTRRSNVQGRHKTHAQCSYVFMRRRGAWASPNAPSSQDDRTYKGKHEHTHKRSNVQGRHKNKEGERKHERYWLRKEMCSITLQNTLYKLGFDYNVATIINHKLNKH